MKRYIESHQEALATKAKRILRIKNKKNKGSWNRKIHLTMFIGDQLSSEKVKQSLNAKIKWYLVFPD
jgi:hypothetical protein